jgi:hypothetical protein
MPRKLPPKYTVKIVEHVEQRDKGLILAEGHGSSARVAAMRAAEQFAARTKNWFGQAVRFESFINRVLIPLAFMLAFAPLVNAQRITEDDPRWDCRTMGNKICGPNAPKPAIYCGAPTKKGTPCKRRVKKAGARCYQHKGVRHGN